MEPKRRFSVEDDIMKSRDDIQLYGIMRCLSTACPQDSKYVEYLTLKVFNTYRKEIAATCNCTSRTVLNRVKALIKSGLVEEGEVETGGKKVACYYFPFEYNGAYKLISKDMLEYLAAAKSPLSLKVYLYLFNKSTMKEDYRFSATEIAKAFGYGETNSMFRNWISICLEDLRDTGGIDFVNITEPIINDNGVTVPRPCMILKNVSTVPPKNCKKFLKSNN